MKLEVINGRNALVFAFDPRKEDVDEWSAALNRRLDENDFLKELQKVIWASAYCRALIYSQPPVVAAIWGASPVAQIGYYEEYAKARGGHANVWLVASKAAEDMWLSLHGFLGLQLSRIEAEWPTMDCFADERNELHHKWIKWLNFVPVGTTKAESGINFVFYRRLRGCVPQR